MKKFIIAAALLVAGCATDVMRGYMGQPVQMAVVDYGNPVNAFDMPDGSRAFQWVIGQSGVTPTNIRETGLQSPSGGQIWWSQNTTITGGQPYSNECTYTMFARWDQARNAWILESFKKPALMCQ